MISTAILLNFKTILNFKMGTFNRLMIYDIQKLFEESVIFILNIESIS